MSRLDFYGKKYESGQPAELQMHQPHLQQTNQKKIKYYSNHEYEETIRKKLILDYPSNLEAQNPNLLLASDKERGQSTKYSTFQQQSNNKRLLQRLDASLKSYQPQFRNKKEIKSINFTQFDLQNELKKQEPTSAYLPQPMKWDEKITSKLQKAKVIEESERLVEEFLPRHRIQKVNKQITALYKQNRNVNLQYRRDKFMQIFTGKSQFSKRSYQAQTQDP